METTYRHQRVTSADKLAARKSIMFPESKRLAIKGQHGFVRTELLTIGKNGPSIGRVTSTGHEIELHEADNITFLLPRAGRLDIHIGGQNYQLSPGRPMAFRATDRVTRSIADPTAKFQAATLQVPVNRMADLARAVGTTPDRAFPQDGMALYGGTGLFLAGSLPRLSDDLFLGQRLPLPTKVAQAIQHLIDDLICEMLEGIATQSASRRIFPAFHRVRQAEDIMHAQSDDPVSIMEIAQTLGVSLRSLQLAFNDVHDGLSPRDYLNRLRLLKARERLLSASVEGQVTTVAMDSGFFHLSRFAQTYARAFGERPSETLARRRA